MTLAPEFTALVTDGKLPEATSRQIGTLIRSLDGKRVRVTVEEVKRKRSLNANAYLWAGVYPPIVAAFREHGNMVDSEDVHSFCKEHVGKLKRVLVTPDGEILHATGSTASLTPTEFMGYISAVRVWAKEVLDVDTPDPHEGGAS
jgi:hypothetical protein